MKYISNPKTENKKYVLYYPLHMLYTEHANKMRELYHTIKLAEDPFYSIQGEGILHLLKPAIFIRVYGCNLKCNFCDTKHAVIPRFNETNVPEYPTITIAKWITERYLIPHYKYPLPNTEIRHTYESLYPTPNPLIIFTGGEPLLYFYAIMETVYYINETLKNYYKDNKDRFYDNLLNFKIHIETNGLLLNKDYLLKELDYTDTTHIPPHKQHVIEFFKTEIVNKHRISFSISPKIHNDEYLSKYDGIDIPSAINTVFTPGIPYEYKFLVDCNKLTGSGNVTKNRYIRDLVYHIKKITKEDFYTKHDYIMLQPIDKYKTHEYELKNFKTIMERIALQFKFRMSFQLHKVFEVK